MPSSDARTGNHLLDLLPPSERADVLPRLVPAPITGGEKLQDDLQPATRVFFPVSGMISLMATLADGVAIETATVGNEGMVGSSIVLGTITAEGRAVGQISGSMLTMSADHFRGIVAQGGKMQELVHAYLLALLSQISQSVACNGHHQLEERLARWLLQSQDRAGSDSFVLTQEFLSHMLGVRRPSVSVAAAALQEAGIIRYRRGNVEILDRAALEEASCECYRRVTEAYDRLVNRFPTAMRPALERSLADTKS